MLDTGFVWILIATGIYGLLHSLMASLRAKALAERWLGEIARRFYRIFYVIFVSITLLPVLALIALLPDRRIYSIPMPWSLLMIVVQLSALLGIFLALKDISVGHFLGLRQAISKDTKPRRQRFVVHGMFRYSRHPLYLFSIIFIWLLPVMTWNVLAFNLGATLYMLIGTIPEERKLLMEFGEDYAKYRTGTPWLIPGFKKGGKEG